MSSAIENLWLWEPAKVTPTEPPPGQATGPSTCDIEESFFKKPVLNNADGEDITDEARDATLDALQNRTKFIFDEPERSPVEDKGITQAMGHVECRAAFANSDAMQVPGLKSASLSTANADPTLIFVVRLILGFRGAMRCFQVFWILKGLLLNVARTLKLHRASRL